MQIAQRHFMTSVRMPEKQARRLAKVIEKKQTTVAAFIRAAVETALEKEND
jgi:predicted DNA-binding protein